MGYLCLGLDQGGKYDALQHLPTVGLRIHRRQQQQASYKGSAKKGGKREVKSSSYFFICDYIVVC